MTQRSRSDHDEAMSNPSSTHPRVAKDTIREVLVLSLWDAGLVRPESHGELVVDHLAPEFAQVAAGEFDAFLDSPGLDPAWIAGWHSAVRHVEARLRKIAFPAEDVTS